MECEFSLPGSPKLDFVFTVCDTAAKSLPTKIRPAASAFQLDVTQEENWRSISLDLGEVDIVVNNAGYFPRPLLAAVALASSLGLHLHQVGQRTFTSKLLSMPSTQRSRWRGGRCLVYRPKCRNCPLEERMELEVG
jgi:NAD(P)-dependent dehydrogenase (short-subunit alcohol dehydrogenase family)